jgi:hypothetical protein
MTPRSRSTCRHLGLGLLAAALTACQPPPPATSPPASPPAQAPASATAPGPSGGEAPAATASPGSSAAAAPLGQPGAAPVPAPSNASAGPPPLTSAQASATGVTIPLARDGGLTLVDPGSGFRVEVAARIADARLILLDAQESLVPASGTTEVGSSTRFTLVPSAALRPGASYTLRLDGVAGREFHDDSGRGYRPLSLPLRATGQPAAPSRTKKRGKHQAAPKPQ